MVRPGLDKTILTILNTKVEINGKSATILEANETYCCDEATGEPHMELVKAINSAFASHQPSVAQKAEMFSILEWMFQCLDCAEWKLVKDFAGSGFQLWSDCVPPQAHPRSGPCIACKEENRKRPTPRTILRYNVNRP